MGLKQRLALGGSPPVTYVDDVFSAYTYTGNGATQTITNGIDLAGKGGLVWVKIRSGAAYGHVLVDSARGTSAGFLQTNTTDAQYGIPYGVTALGSSGFSLDGSSEVNQNSTKAYASWTFAKAPKFFDVVTWTGNGVSGRTIAHSLGQAPGMIFYKRTDTTSDWNVYHRSIAVSDGLVLNSTAATASGNGSILWAGTAPTASVFSVGANVDVNASGGTYVAYLFAHDTGTDGLIQCGSFTTTGGGVGTATLGWEPQFVMVKMASAVLGAGANWQMVDSSRAFPASPTIGSVLTANSSGAESPGYPGWPNATGYTFSGEPSQTYIYMAIRRPNKPPTSGTQVYNAIARTGTGAAATVTGVGFAPDLVISEGRGNQNGAVWYDSLRGTSAALRGNQNGAEWTADSTAVTSFNMSGLSLGADSFLGRINQNAMPFANWFFKRAPGVFDEVCDTGTGLAHTVAHNLAAIPELIIRKGRSGATQWEVYCSVLANTEKLILNSTAAKATDTTAWNSTTPTASVFTVGTGANVNTNAATYVTYLFATKAGISKVNGYTGNGSNQTIPCGFSGGARFVLIKRTDSTGDWYIWDSTRGIVAGNDPHLSLNTTAAEVTTDDSVDADATGFIVNQLAATNVNVNAATYIFLSFA